MSVCDMYVVFI